MSAHYHDKLERLRTSPKIWLITGVAGFIGSHLLETLLAHGQTVVGLDNFETGFRHNLDNVRTRVGEQAWRNFAFHEGDIRHITACRRVVKGVEIVLHQAAIGSVARSLDDPVFTNENNVSGFLNMLVASRDAGVARFVYAASSAAYGDHPGLPKHEDKIGRALSPYAVSKYVNELYAGVFAHCYGLQSIGLRYFNVFGPRQHPDGAYAAVIPRWFVSLLRDEPVRIFGDGKTSRDFCYVANAVQANVLAATCANARALNQVYNVAVGHCTSLERLYELIRERVGLQMGRSPSGQALYGDFRKGDVRHSQADIGKISDLLGYAPSHTLEMGLDEATPYYMRLIA